jgi:hypothetical protein
LTLTVYQYGVRGGGTDHRIGDVDHVRCGVSNVNTVRSLTLNCECSIVNGALRFQLPSTAKRTCLERPLAAVDGAPLQWNQGKGETKKEKKEKGKWEEEEEEEGKGLRQQIERTGSNEQVRYRRTEFKGVGERTRILRGREST